MIAAALVAIAAQAASSPAPAAPSYDLVDHQVRAGDTLIALARRYQVPDWRLIARINGVVRETALRPGSVLKIPVRPSLPTAVARVTSWRGTVTVTVRGASRAVTAPTQLAEGDSIATGAGSFATVTLADGSQSSLPSNTQVRLERLRGVPGRTALDVRFVLQAGGLDTKAAKQRPGDRFEVRTPVAVAAVRGTEFRVAADASAPSRTEVLEGAVAFAAGTAETRVPGGFGTLASSGGVRPPVELLPPPAFADGGAALAGLSVRVAPVAGARAYRFDVATDAGFLDRIAELSVTEPQARFEVGAADLFVRARAVDPDGLVGLASVRAVKAVGSAAPPPEGAARCPARVNCLLFRFADAPGGTRLIIARDAAGRDVAVDRPNLRGDRATVVALPPGEYWFTTEAGTPAARSAAERFVVPAPETGPPAPPAAVPSSEPSPA